MWLTFEESLIRYASPRTGFPSWLTFYTCDVISPAFHAHLITLIGEGKKRCTNKRMCGWYFDSVPVKKLSMPIGPTRRKSCLWRWRLEPIGMQTAEAPSNGLISIWHPVTNLVLNDNYRQVNGWLIWMLGAMALWGIPLRHFKGVDPEHP